MVRKKPGTNIIHKERGNVFFALFGAVAVVGVIGATSMSIMRGPLTTMVEVNKRTQAESQMQLAGRMAIVQSAEQAASGDCDGDGFIEPILPTSFGTAPGGTLTNGGALPNTIGASKTDPWGTEYGYCVWNAGAVDSGAGCSTATPGLIEGSGDALENYAIISVISAGADRTFSTNCQDYATAAGGRLAVKTAGTDDIIMDFTYGEAQAFAGGLWKIKSGDPATAEISKELEVTGGATFTGASTLDLSGLTGSLLLPDDTTSGACNSAANDGVVRRNTATDPPTIEICDWDGGAGVGWVSVAAGATTLTSLSDGGTQIEVDDAVPEIAFDVGGAEVATIDATDLDAGALNISTTGTLDAGNTTITGTFNVTGDADLDANLNVGGAVTITNGGATDPALAVTGDIEATNVDITGDVILANGQSVDWGDGTVNITADSAADTLSLNAAESTFSGNVTMVDLTSTGNADLDTVVVDKTVTITNSAAAGTALTVQGDIDVNGDASISGDIVDVNNITLSATLTAADGVFSGDVQADTFTIGAAPNAGVDLAAVPDCDDANDKLTWSAGSGWGCGTDGAGGSSGDPNDELQNLDEVLQQGNDANGRSALDLGGVAIGRGALASNDLEVQGTASIHASGGAEAITFLNDNNTTTNPDILFNGSSIIAAEDDLFINIDSNNDDADTRLFRIKKDAGTIAGTNLFTVQETGQVDIPNIGLAIGSATISNGTNVNLMLDVTGDVGAIEYCDEDGANCFDAASVAALVGGAVTELDDLTDANTDYGVTDNIFMGNNAGGTTAANNDTNNTAVGVNSMDALNNSGGVENVALGNFTLSDTTSGDYNVAVGVNALQNNTSGSSNVAVGRNALINNDDGGGNIAIGRGALSRNTDGISNTAVGTFSSLYNIGNGNTMLGQSAGQGVDGVSTAFRNVLLGYEAGLVIEAGADNTAVGYQAGNALTDGNFNLFLGRGAGGTTTTGSSNILIGNAANASAAGVSNELNIGNAIYGALGTGQIGIGVSDVTAINASALLQLDSTVRGFLMPRMTTAERNNIVGPATGLQVYNTSTNTVDFYNGSAWVSFASSSGSTNTLIDADSDTSIEVDTAGDGSADTTVFTNNGAETMRIASDGSVGIGTATTGSTLTVDGTFSVRTLGDTNNAVTISRDASTGTLALRNGGTGRVVISSSSLTQSYFNQGNFVFGANTANDSAILQADSTSRGFLPPRVADPVNDIAAPAAGLVAYDSTDNELQVYDGTSWVTFSGGSAAAAGSDREIQFNDGGNLGASQAFVYTAAGDLELYGAGGSSGSKADVDMFRSRGSVASPTAVQTGDEVGTFRFNVHDGAGYINTARITGIVNDNSIGVNSITTDISFFTGQNNGGSERARILGERPTFVVGSDLAYADDYFTNSQGTIAVFNSNPDFEAHSVGPDKGDFTFTRQNGTAAAPTTIADGDEIGALRWAGYTNGDRRRASILGVVNGTVTTTNVPIDILFKTTSSSDDEGLERMRITSGGNIGIGTPAPSELLTITGADGTNRALALRDEVGDPLITLTMDSFDNGVMQVRNNIGSTKFLVANTNAIIDTAAGVMIGATSLPDSSAELEIVAANKGFLPPRVADPVNDIAAPAAGLVAYDSTDNELQVYDGTGWVTFSGGGALTAAIDDLSDAYNDTTTDFDGDATDNDDNLALGHEFATLDGTNPGARNTAIGATALAAVTTGDDNVVLGYNAGSSMTGGRQNVLIGNLAGRDNNSNFNTMLGHGAGRDTTGTHNTLIGHNGGINSLNDYNTVVGSSALFRNTSGENNTIIGAEAAQGTTNGSRENNTVIGFRAGLLMEPGSNNNIFMGHQAGDLVTTGSSNIIIGYDVDPSAATASNELNIGNTIFGDLTNAASDGSGTALIGINNPSPSVALDIIGDVNFQLDTNKSISFNDSASTHPEIVISSAIGSARIQNQSGNLTFITNNPTPHQLFLEDAGGVGIYNSTPDASAVLDVVSTDKGFLPPRVADPLNDIATPATGLVAYDSTDNELQVYDGTSWVSLATVGSTSLWTDNTTYISRENMHVIDAGETITSTSLTGGSKGFIWYSDKSALLAGDIPTIAEADVGENSVALGYNNMASGYGSVAIGYNNQVTQQEAFAFGSGVTATWFGSVGIGTNVNSTGYRSLAMGTAVTVGDGGTNGNNSAVFGLGSTQAGTVTVLGDESAVFVLDDLGGATNITADNSFIVLGGVMGVGTGSPDVNAVLDLTSTDKGFLPPRNADPATNITGTAGLIAYDSTDNELQVYDGTSWVTFSGGAADADWQIDSGNGFVYNLADSIGIGTATPNGLLQIAGAGMSDSDRLLSVTEDGDTLFSVTARNGGSIAHGPARDFSVCLIGGSCLGIDNQGLAARDHLGVRIRAREDEGGADHAISLINDVLMPAGVPLLKVGIGTNAATAEYLRVDSTGAIGVGTGAENDASAIMEVSSASRGFLPPRIADPANDVTSPATGLIAYDSTDNELQVYDGTSWVTFSGGAADADWQIDSGNGFVYNTTDSIGVGTATPDRRFQVENDSSSADSVTPVARLTSTNDGTGTIAAGIGVSMEFEVETADDNNEIGASIEAVTTDVSSGSEDVDLVFKTMNDGGAANEAMRLTSAGSVLIPREVSYRGRGSTGSVPLVGVSSANDAIFGSLTSNTRSRIRITSGLGGPDGDIQLEGDSRNILFMNEALGAESMRINGAGLVGIGTGSSIDASAQLQINATSQGFLPPRIADPAGDITTPATGLIAYDSTDNELQVYDGTSWVTFSGGGAAAIAINDLTDAYADGDSIILGNGTPAGATQDTVLGISAHVNAGADSFSNVVIGWEAGGGMNAAESDGQMTTNTVVGARAGGRIGRNADGNVLFGYAAGAQMAQDADNNVVIGTGAGAFIDDDDNNILIGDGVTVHTNWTTSDHLNIGNTVFADMTNAATGDAGAARVGINSATPDSALEINYAGTASDDIPVDLATITLRNTTAQGGAAIQLFEVNSQQGFEIENYSSADASENYLSFKSYPNSPNPIEFLRVQRDNQEVQFRNLSVGGGAGYVSQLRLLENIDASEDGFIFEYDGANNIFHMKSGFGGTYPEVLTIGRADRTIGIGTAGVAADASAQVEIASTTRGFLPPRIADPANDVTAPATGLIAYDSTDNELQVYDGTSWVAFSGGGASAIAINDLTDAFNDPTTDFNNNATDDDDNMFIGHVGASLAATPVPKGVRNIGVGTTALSSVTTGYENTAMGYNAARDLTTSISGVFIGSQAGEQVTTGNSNVFIGNRAGWTAADSASNVAIGDNALGLIGFGGSPGTANVAMGYRVARSLQDGYSNIVIGSEAAESGNSFDENVIIGGHTATNMTTATGNTIIGHDSGDTLTDGTNNILIGYNIDASAASVSNELNIGNTIYGDLANGYVGIGVANPLFQLHVDDTVAGQVNSAVLNNSTDPAASANMVVATDGGQLAMGIGTAAGNSGGSFVAGTGAGGLFIASEHATDGGIIFQTGPTPTTRVFMDKDGGVSIGNVGAANASSILELTSTTRGFLPPRIADPANDVTAPATGLIAYDSTDDELQVYDGTSWVAFSGGGAAAIAINDLTDAIHDDSTQYNLFLGNGAGASNIGSNNIGIGQDVLSNMYTLGGDNNIGIGLGSLVSADDAFQNVAIGRNAGNLLTNGDDNTLLGHLAGDALTTASRSVLIGSNAGGANQTMNDLVAIGYDAGAAVNTSAFGGPIFIGNYAGNTLTDGSGTMAIGFNALTGATGNNVTSTVAIGQAAMFAAGASASARGNLAVGDFAGGYFGTGNDNVFLGRSSGAGAAGWDGANNVFVGQGIGAAMTGGNSDNNIFIGQGVAATLTSGDSNILIGQGTDVTSATASNELNIGNTIFGDLANGYVGIGMLAPEFDLHMASEGAYTAFVQDSFSDSNLLHNPIVRMRRARGTQAAPTAVQDTTILGSLSYTAYDGDSYDSAASILAIIDGAPADESSPTSLRFLTDNGSAYGERMRISPEGYIGIANTSPDVELDVTGDIEYSGTITDVSDRRLKTDIQKLDTDAVIAKLAQLDTYSFKMKGDATGRTEFGVMAQDIEKLFPELVKTADDEMGTKSVNYMGLIAPMIEVTKALKSENDDLKAELAEMKSQQDEVLAAIKTLNTEVKGLKVHTGFGIEQANSMAILMLLLMIGGLSTLLFFQRKKHLNANQAD